MSNTIIMIHGMWCAGSVWDDFKKPFEEQGYTCLTPSLPYHDGNPNDCPDPRLGSMSVVDYANFLEKQILELEEEPIIVGHSMGGLIAQILASRVQVKAVVLLTPASPWGIWCLWPPVIFTFLTVFLRWGFWRKPMRLSFFKSRYSGLNRFPDDEQKKIYSELVYESGRVVPEIGFWFLFPKRPTAVDESKIECPMLIIGASHDRLTPANVVRRTAKKYNKIADYREYSHLGHWVIKESGWENVAEELLEWIAKNVR